MPVVDDRNRCSARATRRAIARIEPFSRAIVRAHNGAGSRATGRTRSHCAAQRVVTPLVRDFDPPAWVTRPSAREGDDVRMRAIDARNRHALGSRGGSGAWDRALLKGQS